jgi:hypothetical protein
VAVDLVAELLPELLPGGRRPGGRSCCLVAVDLVAELLPELLPGAGAGVCVCVDQVPGVCDPVAAITNIRPARPGPRRVGRGPRGQVRGPRRAWPGA